jgi:hypothetical protein
MVKEEKLWRRKGMSFLPAKQFRMKEKGSPRDFSHTYLLVDFLS